MATAHPFETLTDEYDNWFETNNEAYRAEQAALERILPDESPSADNHALEIGVGTGRFAAPLGLSIGLDPARSALERARNRGVDPVRGVAESLPFADGELDLALFVTVLCFVDDLEATLSEAHRVLGDDGTLAVAVLDRSSAVGRVYQEHKDESPFYADAEFLTGEAACRELERAGFVIEDRGQTVFEDPATLDSETTPFREGHGDGLFAVIRASPAP
ncbi:class I SAM-dependent methyltransferase [Natrialba asiatica]|uniref:Type 11 methyltransferase n=1 Tax=Natrialba asiatica (strain ATCC 700177 / DSM 12278 / JCM 9576 / FERM P-10747 / NBRC 102637 / 172P1) TaxID=29540 RepID=M0B265_NATA1|nr:class I SAM-dependent methyltransferase [Natrialba asiatica]ELZ04875.1 type 11 methyltransferase [Natrialba asiatica DSM 12278]